MKLVAAALSVLLIPVGTLAHHSLAYFGPEMREMVGEVTRVRWGNPHVFVSIQSDGIEWEIESQPANALTRFGVPRETFEVGREIRVAGRIARNGEPSLRLTNVLLPDGTTEALLGQGILPRWSSRVVGFGADEINLSELDSSDESSAGIFRVWPSTVVGGRLVSTVRWPDDLPLTTSAKAKFAQWERTDDPTLQCVPPGMPRGMAQNPFAIQFVDKGDVIELKLEEFDQLRTIFMLEAEIQENTVATPLGYSTGRWVDENTLEVHTTAIDYTLFNQAGVPLSASAEVVERFSLDENQNRLNYEIEVADPDTFTEPVVGSKYWIWQSGEEILPYNCGEV